MLSICKRGLKEVSEREVIKFNRRLIEKICNSSIKKITKEKYYKRILENNEKFNFLVLHLSFIESFHKFCEEKLDKFIEKYHLDDIENTINKKIVITTGRGRDLWKESIEEKSYRRNILFKTIDLLLNSVEEGLIYGDDFMIKHNLVKVLFGS